MTKESSKENNKSAGFKTLINVLRPIRDWLMMANANDTSPPRRRHTPHIVTTNGIGALDDLNGPAVVNRGVVVEEHFKRSAQNRMSLPIMQQQQNTLRRQAYSQLQRRGQQPARSLGHIYLQYNGETKQANLPNELTAIDTVRALFVCAFPNMLTMEYMSQLHVKIYIYNPSCNIFYELRDIDDVRHESVLRIHQSDPILALPQYHLRAAQPLPPPPPPQIPPPKPRRMIPVNGLQSSPNVIYGHLASPNSQYAATPVPNNNHYAATPLQFQQQLQQFQSRQLQLQPINHQPHQISPLQMQPQQQIYGQHQLQLNHQKIHQMSR